MNCSGMLRAHEPEGHWISFSDPIGIRRATGSMDLAWLLSGASPKTQSHSMERDFEEAIESEREQRFSSGQVKARKAGLIHQSAYGFDDLVTSARG